MAETPVTLPDADGIIAKLKMADKKPLAELKEVDEKKAKLIKAALPGFYAYVSDLARKSCTGRDLEGWLKEAWAKFLQNNGKQIKELGQYVAQQLPNYVRLLLGP